MEPQLPTIKNVFVNETDDDDPPALSSQALAALKEFLEEQRQSLANHETAENGEGTLEPESEVALVTEDWRLSQFWYDPETARTLSQEVLSLCSHSNYKVACIACPTLYAYLKKIDPNISVQLLEYDKRFEQYGSDFTFYDYNQPEDLPLELKHTYQVVIADPPYLSKECLEKVTQTISFLAQPRESHLLLLTGEVQRHRAAELLGLRACNFRPRHSSKLGNEFRVFTNYDPGERLGGWEQEQ
ncbi:hypothetical protein E1A91_D09G148500v1 [Gossypium mustelinum]|uniref:Protein-lysine N-methyltransferase E1A91_D09G148500v1 n=1 Tax=Gossypium mustelinum TaxID=34275 RepID=A0A5D2TM06_GOSMU|nr:hypothetical protein E1A91_D09G148500v1 [Gossypium mustelinum]TYI65313.1 hypothetical protein E1A91_D09G148500v1 [Gossypium mustelinum]